MKVVIENVELKNGVVVMYVAECRRPETKHCFAIDTKVKENFKYLRDKFIRLPWARQCKTWGDVLKCAKSKELELTQRYLICAK